MQLLICTCSQLKLRLYSIVIFFLVMFKPESLCYSITTFCYFHTTLSFFLTTSCSHYSPQINHVIREVGRSKEFIICKIISQLSACWIQNSHLHFSPDTTLIFILGGIFIPCNAKSTFSPSNWRRQIVLLTQGS